MNTFYEIAVNLPQVSGTYHYHLPPNWENEPLQTGHLVVVPFGAQHAQGVVLRQTDLPGVEKTRPIADLLDPEPVLTPQQITLAEKLAEYSLAPLAACIALMLPPGINQQAEYEYRRTARPLTPPNLTAAQTRLLNLLETRGALRTGQINRALPRRNWQNSMRTLQRRGLVDAQPVLDAPTARPKTIRTAWLACPPHIAQQHLNELGNTPATQTRRAKMLQMLITEHGRALEAAWLYAESGGNAADLKILAERGLAALGDSEVWRDPLENLDSPQAPAPMLTVAQHTLWDTVKTSLAQAAARRDFPKPILLHGVTGSGKTEIYLRAVAETLRLGRQALILVPEIALTPQTVRRFVARFPGQVGLVHSGLSQGERYDTWRRARAGLLPVIVGPRSALFTPLPKLGLIVVDEFHDESFYQADPPPAYHTRTAAQLYAQAAGAVCIFGSATPDVVSYAQAARGEWQLLTLPQRVRAHAAAVGDVAKLDAPDTLPLPPVQLVDMRNELKEGNRAIFSRALQAALTRTLEAGQQAILFINRRGAATYIFCRDCGYILKCPRCDVPLTLHLESGTQAGELVCHHCNYRRGSPKNCPQCGGGRIRQYGMGTEKVLTEVVQHFPLARPIRWDAETTRKKGAHEAILNQFASGRANVLVGTQMLAKGIDLPRVTLVGVVLADIGLGLPDYRAGERAFQVLMQVAGRAGRSALGGAVIFQTFQPEHYAIQAAAMHDYAQFYRLEMAYRQKTGYPPFGSLLRIELRGSKPDETERAAHAMAQQLNERLRMRRIQNLRLIGPAPCFFAREGSRYRWQIVLCGKNPAALIDDLPLKDWRVQVDPLSLL